MSPFIIRNSPLNRFPFLSLSLFHFAAFSFAFSLFSLHISQHTFRFLYFKIKPSTSLVRSISLSHSLLIPSSPSILDSCVLASFCFLLLPFLWVADLTAVCFCVCVGFCFYFLCAQFLREVIGMVVNGVSNLLFWRRIEELQLAEFSKPNG